MKNRNHELKPAPSQLTTGYGPAMDTSPKQHRRSTNFLLKIGMGALLIPGVIICLYILANFIPDLSPFPFLDPFDLNPAQVESDQYVRSLGAHHPSFICAGGNAGLPIGDNAGHPWYTAYYYVDPPFGIAGSVHAPECAPGLTIPSRPGKQILMTNYAS